MNVGGIFIEYTDFFRVPISFRTEGLSINDNFIGNGLFRLQFLIHFDNLEPSQCYSITLEAYSLGAAPEVTDDSFDFCTLPPTPTVDDPGTSTRRQFKLHLCDEVGGI